MRRHGREKVEKMRESRFRRYIIHRRCWKSNKMLGSIIILTSTVARTVSDESRPPTSQSWLFTADAEWRYRGFGSEPRSSNAFVLGSKAYNESEMLEQKKKSPLYSFPFVESSWCISRCGESQVRNNRGTRVLVNTFMWKHYGSFSCFKKEFNKVCTYHIHRQCRLIHYQTNRKRYGPRGPWGGPHQG